MQEQCVQKQKGRNRRRSKRRAIYCPYHGCYLNSTSPKYRLFADQANQLQQRGMSRLKSLLVVAAHGTVILNGEWLEQFWCPECEASQWYHVQRQDKEYELMVAPMELWTQVQGVIHPHGNPSVSEFTRRQSRLLRYRGVQDFGALG